MHHTDLFSSFRPLIVSAGPCFRKLKAKTFFVIIGFGKRQLKSRKGAPSIISGPHFQKYLV